MDSLMGLELRDRIEAALGVTAPAALGWTYPTAAAMTRWLLEEALAVHLGAGGGPDMGKSTADAKASVHLLRFRPVVRPRARLFCFHGSGGSPEIFRSWADNLDWHDVEIIAMWHDRSLASQDAPGKKYVYEAASLIQRHADAPFALVGMSLGVRFAMGTAIELTRRSSSPAPLALFMLGGSLILSPITPEMAASLLAKGFFRDVTGHARPAQQVRSDFRADAAIAGDVEVIRGDSKEPLLNAAVPIIAVAGSDDVFMPPSNIQDLKFSTKGRFCIHLLPGDHEFLIDRNSDLMQIVGSHLDDLLS